MAEKRLQLRSISKRFAGHVALDSVDLGIRPGEVHGLLGENGAGKSTLLNILSGVLPMDSGSIQINGQTVNIRNPLTARAAGVAMIHQELQHVPDMTVAQNMFLGRALTRTAGLLVDRRRQERQTEKVLSTLDPSIDPASPIRNLKVAQRQLVEIARALLEKAQLIAMDEPTSSLTPSEFDQLAALIVDLSRRGVSIIYVSHKLSEVFRVCERATILRDGALVDVVKLADSSETEVTAKMVGRELAHTSHRSFASRTCVLQVENLGRKHQVRNVSFSLYQGEVLGISGLVGAGRTELLRLIAGIDRPDSGSIHLHGIALGRHNPRAAIRAGIGLLPEERKRDGIIPERSVVSNLGLPSLGKFTRLGIIRRRMLKVETERFMGELQLKPLAIHRPIATFSGGNQQKVIIGRWLAASADVLLFDEPTRGIDVGAKAEIYSVLESLAAEGKAIIVVSSEMQELIRVADRVLVMRDGCISATLTDEAITENDMLRWAIPQGSSAQQVHSISEI